MPLTPAAVAAIKRDGFEIDGDRIVCAYCGEFAVHYGSYNEYADHLTCVLWQHVRQCHESRGSYVAR